MLDRIENSVEHSDGHSAAAPTPVPAETLRSRLRYLQRHRLAPQLIATGQGPAAGGLPLRVSVREYLGSAAAAEILNDCLGRALSCRAPVTLALTDLDYEENVTGSFEAFCLAVNGALRARRLSGDLLSTCIRSHVLPLQAYLVIASTLGKGRRYVMLDSLQMQYHADQRVQAVTDANWIELWHRRHATYAAQAVYGEAVRSRCPLLGDEKTASVLPAFSMPVPAESAWLPVRLHLPDFSDGRGVPAMPALRAALRACLEISDSLLPQLFAASEAQRSDARTNNRVALLLTGIGDLVIERRADPTDIHCLRWADDLIAAIHSELWNYSMKLAGERATLPSLLQSDPLTAWHSTEHQRDWSGRWRQTLRAEAVRHRNLLVLSPYSVLPGGAPGGPQFTDLLPLLGHADAICFHGAPALSNWNVNDFSKFHRRAWAVIMRGSSASRIAAGA